MRKYFSGERPFGGHLLSSTPYHRLAVITEVNAEKGTIALRWLDHPGGREDIVISQAAFGSWEFPVPGATILVAMRKGDLPEIDRYIPIGYAKQVETGQTKQLYPGEKLFRSYDGSEDAGKQFPVPVPTGSEIYMSRTGKIIFRDGVNDWWEIDPKEGLIHQNSMTYQNTTEAGILDFGLVRREMPTYPDPTQNTEMVLVTQDNIDIADGGKAFTEFRLRIIETADVDPTTAPEVDDPLVEVVLGTKIQRVGSGLDTEYSPELTPSDAAEAGNEICVQLRTKGTVGFEFTIDKVGNVTMRVKDSKKLKIICSDVEVDSDKVTVVGTDIKLGGGGGEKAVVLSDFISDFNSHTHPDPVSGTTGTPTTPVTDRISTKTKVE